MTGLAVSMFGVFLFAAWLVVGAIYVAVRIASCVLKLILGLVAAFIAGFVQGWNRESERRDD
ncbi:hypothetical protein [Salinarimonas rosea]|uniref:hypothetical protein n=1 Tax=Salinarimonas rosea TaxID=552063 RepID=UPI00041954BE|nr:hypothetical protein [Salinarimonas rosea]